MRFGLSGPEIQIDPPPLDGGPGRVVWNIMTKRSVHTLEVLLFAAEG